MNMHRAYNLLTLHQQYKDMLLVQFPELAEDEGALLDTLEGLTDLNENLIAILRSRDDDLMLVTGIEARVKELNERKARLELRADAKRAFVCRVMEEAELKRLDAPDWTVSLGRKPQAVQITDEAAVPAEYWREKVTRSVDKTALKAALATGKVPGAALDNGGVQLTIRKK